MAVHLHVGTHKTGSKSLQALLGDHASQLAEMGYDLYRGTHRNPRNHTELHLATQRIARDSLAKHNWPELAIDRKYVRGVRDSVRRFLDDSRAAHQIFTNEDLAFLRYPDEFARLAGLFGEQADDVRTVIVRRERGQFLRAYRQQILKKPGRMPSSDPASALYVGTDSWLCELQLLIDGLASTFGRPPAVIDYERALGCDGSILPAILGAMDIDPAALPWRDYFLHRSRPDG